MSSSTVLRAALRRWYIAVPGVLLSLLIASTVFGSMPAKYTSSGIAVLVRQNNPTTANSINPVLGNDGGFTTATLTLVQALDTPTVRAELGLREGVDDFTISNVSKSPSSSGGDHPFLYITTRSSNPQKSTEIVGDVINAARQKLTELQNDFHVRPQNQIKVESVVDATPPKAVMNMLFAVTGAVLMLGIITTCIAAYALDRVIAVRQKQQIHRPAAHATENAHSRVRAKPHEIS
jgi:capsular polysaccharide biosynthesis protein